MAIIAFNRCWVIRWQWVMVSFFATAFLASLSLWQLSRATEKKQTLARISQWKSSGPLNFGQLQAVNADELDGARLKFSASWIQPMIWLLDNRIVDGRIGYDVVIAVKETPTSLPEKIGERDTATNTPAILVNLGWVAAPLARDQLPAVNIPPSLIIDGIFRTKPTGLLLGTNIEDRGSWPMRIQQLDAPSLAKYFPTIISAGVIFQQEQSPFRVHYAPVILPPERHHAYALQWGLLALAVVVISIAASATREINHEQP